MYISLRPKESWERMKGDSRSSLFCSKYWNVKALIQRSLPWGRPRGRQEQDGGKEEEINSLGLGHLV